MNKYLRLLFDPKFRFSVLAAKGFFRHMPDREFYEKSYRLSYGKKLDLANPKGFSEKIMWLKLYDRKPLYSTLVDKYAVRSYLAERLGEEYLIPLVGGPWEHFDDIDFSLLPQQFVLKCTHDSGSVIVCRDKDSFDRAAAREKLSKRLKRNYYYGNREWPYKDVAPRIIAEEYLCQSGSRQPVESGQTITASQLQREQGLLDYKFLCFNGEVKVLFLDIGVIDGSSTATNYFRNIYDRNFNLLPVLETRANFPQPVEKPLGYENMLAAAEKLSQGFPSLRVDMYNLDGKIYIGELTLYHGAGLGNFFYPPEWDEIFGSWIELPEQEQSDKPAAVCVE